MPKRKAFVHIGLDDGSGDVIDVALAAHTTALAELGVRCPAESTEQLFRAALEMLRTHREWGYKRGEVEGAWVDAVRPGLKGRDTLVFSQTLLAAARPEQADLLVDALGGFEVHVVVTVRAPGAWTVPGEPTRDLGSVLDRWAHVVRRPERLHVIVAGDSAATWKAFGKVVGFGTSSLRVTDLDIPDRARAPHLALVSRAAVLESLGRSWVELLASTEHHVVGDPARLVPDETATGSAEDVASSREHALSDALLEIERLTRRTQSLERRLDVAEKKRRKLKRRLRSVA